MNKHAYPPRSRASRRRRDTTFRVVAWITASAAVLILAVLFAAIISQGLKYLDLSFLQDSPSRKPEKAGLGPAMWGSIWICTVCALTALPLGVGTAIFLEEYKPRATWMRRVHGFVQLNISNLAGVPSIVYGIIGLTVFVQFCGYGSASDPSWQIGVKVYDSFVDESGEYLREYVSGPDAAPVALADGMTLDDDYGEPVVLRVVPEDWEWDEATAAGSVRADAYAERYDEKTWYYLQIPFGRGVLAGGLTLMLVILPIVIISSQEAIRAVPMSLREAAFGLGATRWQSIRRMTLPAAVPGIMTGAILAMSRAIGEAAPILIIAGIVYITFTPGHLMDDFTAMPLQIYNWAGLPKEEFHRVAASGIIVLLVVLLTFNALAVFVRQKFQKPLQ